MDEFICDNLEHVLCILILVGRIGDIASTYLLTPTLRLEGNLLAKKLGWRFAWLSVLLCLVPYYSPSLGVIVLVPSLFVSASNIGKIWFVRSFGERQFAELLLSVADGGKLRHALFGVALSSAFVMLAGAVLWYLCPDPEEDWGFEFAIGIMAYGMAILVHGSLSYWRLFRKAKAARE